eukprot:scaffold565_cov379-Pinguiococcus_pyrenoidosus.AAC.19
MCRLAARYTLHGVEEVKRDVERITKLDPAEMSKPPTVENEVALSKKIANAVFHTCYMGSDNSSAATNHRSKALAEDIGAYHLTIRIDDVASAVVASFTEVTGNTPVFMNGNGSSSATDKAQDLALQNVQARSRMVLAYFYAQLLPWQRKRSGFLLVLGSGNVDEALRGYLTKYDCSSADLNPIGAISKVDLKRMLYWAANHYGYKTLLEIVSAPPTAELRPMEKSENGEHSQTDEADMGMTYDELGVFGVLRKIHRCGPVSMMKALVRQWHHLSPASIAEKVKRFFVYYGINRHKSCTLTPAYHAEQYSPDDNSAQHRASSNDSRDAYERFDLRQFLYNVKWDWQFAKVDEIAAGTKQECPPDGGCKRGKGADELTREFEDELEPPSKKQPPPRRCVTTRPGLPAACQGAGGCAPALPRLSPTFPAKSSASPGTRPPAGLARCRSRHAASAATPR